MGKLNDLVFTFKEKKAALASKKQKKADRKLRRNKEEIDKAFAALSARAHIVAKDIADAYIKNVENTGDTTVYLFTGSSCIKNFSQADGYPLPRPEYPHGYHASRELCATRKALSRIRYYRYYFPLVAAMREKYWGKLCSETKKYIELSLRSDDPRISVEYDRIEWRGRTSYDSYWYEALCIKPIDEKTS